jgi:hypothetical protein
MSESRNDAERKIRQGVSVFDQFHLQAQGAILSGSVRHLGTSWESKLSGILFTIVLSLPIFSLPVYLVFMLSGAPAGAWYLGPNFDRF